MFLAKYLCPIAINSELKHTASVMCAEIIKAILSTVVRAEICLLSFHNLS